VSEPKERTAVYRIRDEAGELLYIGMTNCVPVRWNQHMLYQPWWDELRSLTVEFCGSREEAAAAEKAAILAERPKYNRTYLMPRQAKSSPAPVRESLQPVAARGPETWGSSGPLIASEEAAEFLAITEMKLAELLRSDSGLSWYDLGGRGNYVRFRPDELRAYKATLVGRAAA
jgi:predicted GIY-YIG superfamily endonuclease